MRLEFTGDRQRLLDTIDKFQAGYGMDRRQTMSNSVHNALAAVSAMAKWLSAVDDRRKTILFISEGFDGVEPEAVAQRESGDRARGFLTREDDQLGRLGGASADVVEVAEMAARSNVTVYGIDPIGLPGGTAGSIKPAPWLADDDVTNAAGQNRLTTNRAALTALSETTGGFATTRTNDYDAAFDRVVHESSSYYLLGYVSTNSAHDGKFRRVKVTTTRPGLTVRTRSGYVSERDKVTPALTPPKGWSAELLKTIQSQGESSRRPQLASSGELAPGHHVMRVGGADAVAATAGSVHYQLDVPDFTKAR
ncbi:MAG TPA: VWA domain-containing protein [Vicinamibacterales bacterium]|jgi:VWFA-related protein|nr:VWA domain-containing protein [Vicinamibacterales bacterium]